MGSWDGAESTDLVGLYLLSKLKDLGVDVGLYRDDGLILSRLTARRNELLKNEIVKIFNDLKLDIEVNKSVVNFLDLTLDLQSGLYTPYMKENDTILYVNRKSNHPPSILKNIPESINNRLTRNSSNQNIFNSKILPY